MMTDYEFDLWCSKNNISASTRDYINNNIRHTQPVRSVGGGELNVPGNYPSKKMGVTIQTESGKVEGPAVLMLENDEDVLEYYDQPNKINLQFMRRDGRNAGTLYTPDFFVIRKLSAGWEEWKNDDDLIKTAKMQEWKYTKTEGGNWTCPPGEMFAKEYGLTFKVCTSNLINWNLHRNYVFLDDYFRKKDLKSLNKEYLEQIRQLIFRDPGISLKQLIDYTIEYDFSTDDIYKAIIQSDIYVDLATTPLAERELVKVFLHKEHANMYINLTSCKIENQNVSSISFEVGSRVLWDNQIWSIINWGTEFISLYSDGKYNEIPKALFLKLFNEDKIVAEREENKNDDSIIEIIISANEDDYKLANYRLQHVKNYLEHGSKVYQVTSNPNLRKVRDWVSKYRESEKLLGNGYVGLLPKDKNKGNRQNRYSLEVVQLMDLFIEEEYENMIQKNKSVVYGAFKNSCIEKGYHPPSLATFCKRVDERPIDVQIEKRQGKRAKYQKEIYYWELETTTPRHGDFPFNIGHLDHTELDIELVCSRTGKNLGRPYLSLLMDAYTRRVLGFYISFEKPSYRSCMMVIRDCVRRYNRLPQQLVVDNGNEFHSTYFITLLAMYEREPKWRPAAKARFGSILERLFGTTNTNFIHNLQGNTKIMKNVRIVTKSVNPKNHAVWNLQNLSEALEEFFFELYDSIEHPALGQSPREAFKTGVFYSGERKELYINYDKLFEILTLPSTANGKATIQQNGIKINYIYYWNEEFKSLHFKKTKVKVRFDPFNIGIAYAYVNKRWIKCFSQYYPVFSKISQVELKFITSEIKKSKQKHAKGFTITAQKIAQFLQTLENNQQYTLLKNRSDETRKVIKLQFNQNLNDNDEDVKSKNSINKSIHDNSKESMIDDFTLELYEEF